jgi:hypothetical protein
MPGTGTTAANLSSAEPARADCCNWILPSGAARANAHFTALKVIPISMPRCLFLLSQLSDGPVGLGWDLATTTNETSNPSAFSVLEQRGVEFTLASISLGRRPIPDVAMERAAKIIRAVKASKEGGPARRLCVDATNERYFSQLSPQRAWSNGAGGTGDWQPDH